jgi:hypothetical protein
MFKFATWHHPDANSFPCTLSWIYIDGKLEEWAKHDLVSYTDLQISYLKKGLFQCIVTDGVEEKKALFFHWKRKDGRSAGLIMDPTDVERIEYGFKCLKNQPSHI